MTTLTITAKGQITLKKALLRQMGVGPGDRLDARIQPDGGLNLKASRPVRSGRMSDAFGTLKREGQTPLSIEEMNEIIAKGWAGQL